MPEIVLITPTGGRPEAFVMCQQMIQTQTVSPYRWIIIDDSPNALDRPTTVIGEVMCADKKWAPGHNTQRENLNQAFETIGEPSPDRLIFFIEDDDYYNSKYLEVMSGYLAHINFVGISDSRYYNLMIPGYKYMRNFSHSSLANTGFRDTERNRDLVMQAINSGHYYIDIELWKQVHSRRITNVLVSHTNLSIGIKGLPGRRGLGAGHSREGYFLDEDLSVLENWLDGDAFMYNKFIKHEGLPPPKSMSEIRQKLTEPERFPKL